ncbi:MAG: CapA family protein [Promethearchaeota archaeon]
MIENSDPKLKYIATPYNLKETLGWFRRNFFGVCRKNRDLVKTLPRNFVLNKNVNPKYSLAFIGDIMDMNGKNLFISRALKDFIQECDYLIGNFEATITKAKGAFMAQRHISQILDALADLFDPQRSFLSLANNHAGDFGRKLFTDSINEIKARGFSIFGITEQPYIDIQEDIRIIGGTMWSNQKCNYVVKFDEVDQYLKTNAFNILYPHWSYELELYPRPKTVEIGQNMIKKFDAIVGHHSHCPQPISTTFNDGINKLIAYGLGDFCIWEKLKHYLYGLVLKIEIGPNQGGIWQIGKISWNYVNSAPQSENAWLTDITLDFPYLK